MTRVPSVTPQSLQADYRDSLTRFARGEGESALAIAYELGRKGLLNQISLLELTQMHSEALRALAAEGHGVPAEQAWQFLTEALSPYELSLRAHHENAKLLGLGHELSAKNAELGRAHGQLQAILDATLAVIYLRDPGGRFLFVNRRFDEFFEVRGQQLLGTDGHGVVDEVSLSVLGSGDRAALVACEPVEREERYVRGDAEHTYLALKFPLLDGGGAPYAVCSVATDISERQRVAEALRAAKEETEQANRELKQAQAKLIQTAKMASLGELVAGIAHEINNPLAFVTAHLGTVQRSLGQVESTILEQLSEPELKLWERAQQRAQEMSLGLSRIHELVLKLRTFSRLDEGERKRADLRECVDSVLTILGHRLNERVELTVTLSPPDVIECYPALLNQALMNLLTNAIDAVSQSGGGKVELRGGPREEYYDIELLDDGPGIPDEIRDRVVEPFFTTKPVGQGTGLGLSITYSIVQRHAGVLSIQNRETGGTRIVLSLPLNLENR